MKGMSCVLLSTVVLVTSLICQPAALLFFKAPNMMVNGKGRLAMISAMIRVLCVTTFLYHRRG